MNRFAPILVVDDSETQLAILRDALQNRGFQVETASNGIEAMTRVYHSPPGLILSDVLMPELNGYHLCRLLKNDPLTAAIPIILLTNLRERHDRFWGEKAGADRYLEKTTDLDPILDTVTELALHRAPQGLRRLPSKSRDLSSEDIQSRVTTILDRLLYESTISNEILKLTGLAHDGDQLVSEVLRFLSVICRHSAASLLFADGDDKYLLAIHSVAPLGEAALAAIREQTWAASERKEASAQVREILVPPDDPETSPLGDGLQLLHTLPISDQGTRLALFHDGAVKLTDGSRHSLTIVADRLQIVIGYLRKTREIEQVKADFVSMLVHDLRAPLTSIRGFTNILAEGIYGDINTEQKNALGNVESGCDRLLALIEDILDLSKLEAGKLKLHSSPLQLMPLLEKTLADLSPLFAEKSIQVELEIPEELPYLLADGKQLVRVFANLLSNAAKFTPADGRVVVSTSLPGGAESDLLQVSVTDTGEGIPVELQKLLFGKFQQLPSRGPFRKGTGLGLAICQEIIHLHGGRIWVESPLGPAGGSRFVFTLPLLD
ncbi:hypothetical protein JCM30471_05350 [Desulfuromonas carbonis]|uniref:hybrid sensor histidine kinase/response regulator n=1 Tax=Desulfuromonas sp. DDH964 TaxID=1823759 RepID=UPI00078B9D1C|nr:hybrid sensor histidine kinase/response regulator [Desulfuromonas sp. DDH964]AMV72035.1 sensor histidine kinase, HAMP and PAS domain-containing [Desulfuromonas sp. DDH964]